MILNFNNFIKESRVSDIEEMKGENKINTLDKFLRETGFSRNTNHPSVSKLKYKMDEFDIEEDLKIDIMSFFLYDHESK